MDFNLTRIKQHYLKFLRYGYLTLKICIFKNNVFCTLRSSTDSSFYKILWSGQHKVKVSSKSLRFEALNLLRKFLKVTFYPKSILGKALHVIVVGPKNIRRKLLSELLTFFDSKKKKSYFLELPYMKPFNGCRARKIVRKKRKKLHSSLFKFS